MSIIALISWVHAFLTPHFQLHILYLKHYNVITLELNPFCNIHNVRNAWQETNGIFSVVISCFLFLCCPSPVPISQLFFSPQICKVTILTYNSAWYNHSCGRGLLYLICTLRHYKMNEVHSFLYIRNKAKFYDQSCSHFYA